MKFLRQLLDNQKKNLFSKGKKLEKFAPIYDAVDTFLYNPGTTTSGFTQIRDVIDYKRIMIIVFISILPTLLMALYNTGYQGNLVIESYGKLPTEGWRNEILLFLGCGFDPNNILDNVMHGAVYFFPVYIVTLAVGSFWEGLFAVIRREEIHEAFFVTSILFALIVPPSIPLWQVALGISFGIVIGKEVFGGVGMNILNPALTARAFLYFAYPAQSSGNSVWTVVDTLSQASPLGHISNQGMTEIMSIPGKIQGIDIAPLKVSFMDAFLGFIPGSMGETSALACLIGAFLLIITGIGSWRIMISVVLGMTIFSLLFNFLGSTSNPMFAIPPWWHFVLGGFAFGTVYMATDPVSATVTRPAQYIYGFLIGSLCILVRVVNPAFPEGIMLAILFMNVFAPSIDRFFINANIKRRMQRNVVG